MTWQDSRGGDNDIYAQRVNSGGVVQWSVNGVAVCTASGAQSAPRIISDGAGGAIITWDDSRHGDADIYAQRLNSSGDVLWSANGVCVCMAAGGQTVPELVSDGSHGAIITWQDSRDGNPDIYARRVNANGVVQWAADGVAICTAPLDQLLPQVCSDGSAGAIIVWRDERWQNEPEIEIWYYYCVYGQRIDSVGMVKWAADGAVIGVGASSLQFPEVISDGSGGAIVAMAGHAVMQETWIEAVRVDPAGSVQWSAQPEFAFMEYQLDPQIVSDGSGGAIITWRSSLSDDLYAMRVNSAGVLTWSGTGVAVCSVSGTGNAPQLIGDGSGGAIITWEDLRGGSLDICAQKVNSSGAFQWTDGGTAVSTAPGSQELPQVVSDGTGGAIIAWQDYRSSSEIDEPDIYAQRVKSDGTLDGDASTHAMSGRVTLSGTGLQGVTVSLTGAASKSTTTDASGNYTFGGLANGSYTVTPSMSGHTFSPSSSVQVVNGADITGVNFAATTTTFSISGTVALSGAGLQGVMVSMTGVASASTTTDASGDYTFMDVANGSYTVTPSMSGYTFTPSSSAQVVSGADIAGVNFAATVTSYGISGTITLSGVGQPGVTMTLTGSASASATTDASGNYAFTGLANGSYTVTPSMSGYAFSPSSSAQVVNGADITGVNFAATTTTFGISGTVTLSGAGLQGVMVSLTGVASASTTTDASGDYTFMDVANGNYTVTPTMSGYTFDPASGTLLVDGVSITGVNFAAAAIAEGAPPTVTTADPDNIKADSARLHGGLSSPGTAASVTLSFVWGTTSGSYPNETTNVAQSTAGTFYYDLGGLSPGTTYYYKAKAAGDGVSFGAEESFTTAVGGSPAITGLVASSGRPGDELTVTITGSNLSGATAVDFGAKITVSDLRAAGDTEITVKVAIDKGAEAGKRDVSVTTPQGTVTAPGIFVVNYAGPTVRLWVYLLAGVGGIAALGIVASLGLRLMRRRTTQDAGGAV